MSQVYVGNGSGGSGATDLHVAKWIVNNLTDSGGNQTSITAAVAAASSGDTIFVMPGSTGVYTENITLKAGVNIVAFDADAETPNVTIKGNITASYSGTVSISGINLQTNGSNCLTVSGSNATIINLINCNVTASNATAISFTNSNAASVINLSGCIGNLGTTGIGLISSSSAGLFTCDNCSFTNTGGSSTGDSFSAGALTYDSTYMEHPISISGTASGGMNYLKMDTTAVSTACVTVSSTLACNSNFCSFTSGTASALVINGTFNAFEMIVYSTNTNAITGSGTLFYSPISFFSSSGVNVSTQTTAKFGPKISPVMSNTNGVVYYDGTNLNNISPGTSGQILLSNGSGSAPSFGSFSVKIQTFTTTGTYTPTTGMQYCIMECQGAGGGGGGAATTLATTINGGGGGGSGSYSRIYASASTVGASQTVTIGAGGAGGSAGNNAGSNGGNTSVGSICVANGGGGGGGAASNSSGSAGAAGTTGTGTLTIAGNPGYQGPRNSDVTIFFPTSGANSMFGQGGILTLASSGANATGYGAGGAGGSDYNSGTNEAGGNGSSGLVIITEYIF